MRQVQDLMKIAVRTLCKKKMMMLVVMMVIMLMMVMVMTSLMNIIKKSTRIKSVICSFLLSET
jgi:hypothetical protein